MSVQVKLESRRGLNLAAEQMDSRDMSCHPLPSQQGCTGAMQIPVNSVTSGEAEIEEESQKNGKETFRDDPIDSESVKGIFGWETIDDTSIPYILRKKRKFVSVRIVERKLLSKYPNTFPDELGKKDPLVSYFITEAEASLLNEINTAHCDFDYGHSSFTVKDLIVDLEEFEEFFRVVKKTFPAEVLAKIGGEPSSPVMSPAVETELSQFCGWIQINNTVSPYILRLENGRQVKLVPLSVIIYAAGLLTNSSVDGLLPTPHECAMLNEACKAAGFDFLFGKNTRLISISEVLHRCQVQIFELPFKNPLQHARYLDPCTGQPSSNPLMGFVSHPLSNTSAVQHQPPPSIKSHQRVLDLVSGNTSELNPYVSGFSGPPFHPSQFTVPGGLSGVSSGLSGFREPSPARMRLPGPHTGTGMEATRFHNPRSQMMTDKSLDNSGSLKQGGLPGGSLWAAMPRAPPPAHANNTLNSMVSKNLPISPDPPVSSPYQHHSLPPNPLLHSRNSPAQPDLNHPIFRGPMNALQRSPGAQPMHKDHPAATVRYPPPVTGLPLPPPPYSNSSSFPFGVNQFDSSLFARTDLKPQRHIGDTHILSSQSKSQQYTGDESLKYIVPHSANNGDQKITNSDHNQHIISTYSKNQPKSDMSHNISACLVNGKSISCINVDLPHRKGRFCLVEAVSKLYFPTVPLTEFVKVLQVVLKVNLHECTPQEETAFVQYYNLPVNKLKCNKIIKVDDLEAYFPQLNYMFTKCSPDPVSAQPAVQQPSPSHSVAPKRRMSSPTPGPASKMLHPKLENVVRMLNQGKDITQNGGKCFDLSEVKCT